MKIFCTIFFVSAFLQGSIKERDTKENIIRLLSNTFQIKNSKCKADLTSEEIKSICLSFNLRSAAFSKLIEELRPNIRAREILDLLVKFRLTTVENLFDILNPIVSTEGNVEDAFWFFLNNFKKNKLSALSFVKLIKRFPPVKRYSISLLSKCFRKIRRSKKKIKINKKTTLDGKLAVLETAFVTIMNLDLRVS